MYSQLRQCILCVLDLILLKKDTANSLVLIVFKLMVVISILQEMLLRLCLERNNNRLFSKFGSTIFLCWLIASKQNVYGSKQNKFVSRITYIYNCISLSCWSLDNKFFCVSFACS